VRNLTGFGDALSGTYADGRGGPSYSAAWSIPFGPYGTSFQASYDAETTALIEETLSALNIESEFTSLGLTLTQPLIDTLRQRLALGLTWADRESSSKLLGQPFAFVAGEPEGGTEVRVWRFFQDYLQRWSAAYWPCAPPSASAKATSWNRRSPAHPEPRLLRMARPVPIRASGDGQRRASPAARDRPGNLRSPGAAGADRHRRRGTVRGYPENQLVRDIGYAGSVEFHYPAVPPPPAVARSRSSDSSTAEPRAITTSRQSLASIGIGLSGRYKGLFGEIYLAHRLRTCPGPGVEPAGSGHQSSDQLRHLLGRRAMSTFRGFLGLVLATAALLAAAADPDISARLEAAEKYSRDAICACCRAVAHCPSASRERRGPGPRGQRARRGLLAHAPVRAGRAAAEGGRRHRD